MPDVRLRFLETLSMGATFRSTAYAADGVRDVGFIVRTVTSDGVGTWRVQVSNDYDPSKDDPTSDAKWTAFTPAAGNPADSASAAQSLPIVLAALPFFWVRIIYTRTAGTGSAIVIPTGKN